MMHKQCFYFQFFIIAKFGYKLEREPVGKFKNPIILWPYVETTRFHFFSAM
jgi:hypothetical protein